MYDIYPNRVIEESDQKPMVFSIWKHSVSVGVAVLDEKNKR